MENNMEELSPELLEQISGGELKEMDKIALDRNIKRWKSQGGTLKIVKARLNNMSPPEVVRYVEEHWDSN